MTPHPTGPIVALNCASCRFPINADEAENGWLCARCNRIADGLAAARDRAKEQGDPNAR